jgi:hypothetical protein
MRRVLSLLLLAAPMFAATQKMVTVNGGMSATSPFTVGATGTSNQAILNSQIYLDGKLFAKASGNGIAATIAASPGIHRITFSFTQSSGELLRSAIYVNVLESGGAPASHNVALNWNASPSSGVDGYRVFRGNASGGPYSAITSTVAGLTYEDPNVVSGRTYYYVVAAVGTNGMQSAFSGETAAVIP